MAKRTLWEYMVDAIATCTEIRRDTWRKLNVHKTFRRRPERLMYVQFTSCVQGDGGNKIKA